MKIYGIYTFVVYTIFINKQKTLTLIVRKILLSLVVVLSVTLGAFAQNKQISGSVVDASGAPIYGAAVIVEGTSIGTSTDSNGKFEFSVPTNGAIVVSYLGYISQNVPLQGKNAFAIILEEDTQMLDDVIVVAYGTTTKEAFTGSAGVVKAEDLEKRQVSNVSNALAGAVAGVQVLSSNGQPGTTSTVLVRGVGSINAGTTPLYVVDGVSFDGDLSSLNSSDIASMTVLKDAASTAMYGARGANGVILITTKRGKEGKAVVNFDGKVGVNSRQVANYDVLTSAETYLSTLYTANYNAGIGLGYSASDANVYANGKLFDGTTASIGDTPIYTTPSGELLFDMDGNINPNSTLGYSNGSNYYTPDNWSDEMFSNKARQEYNLSVAGGSGKTTYYTSFGYLDDQGVITGSSFERYSTRVNLDHQAKDWLKVGANVNYSYTNSAYPGEQTNTSSSANAFWMANYIAPVYPLYVRDADGTIATMNGMTVYDYGDGQNGGMNRSFMSISNPASDLLYNTTEYLTDNFNANWFATITPLEGLSLTARYGISVANMRYNDLGNAYFGQSASYGGTAYQYTSRDYGFTQQYVANYNFEVGDGHSFDIMAAYDGYEWNYTTVSAYGTNLYDPESFYVSNAIDNRRGYGTLSNYATEGYIARVAYNYLDTYYVSASFRRDASSRFSEDNRWGNFFSLSGAWILTNESFMDNVEIFNMLKFKASYGEQGNDQILDSSGYQNYYPYLDQYTVTGSDGSFSDGTLYYKGNEDLTWETSVAANIGFDFAMLNNRLSGSLEWFARTSKDMLYMQPTPSSLGYSEIPVNVGSMRNSGVELVLSGLLVKTLDFSWTVDMNITSVKNKIISLASDLEGELVDGTRIYTEGESMYRMYLVEWAGVNDETGQAEYWTEDEDGVREKTTDWADASSYKVTTDDLLPDFYGGFGTTVQYKNFDASIQFSYQLGGQIYDSGYATLMHEGYSNAGYNWHTDILDAWTEDNTDSEIPRVCTTDYYANATSTRFLTSSNYLAINNITVGYTLPQSLTQKWSIDKFRIYFAADNVALWSARQGLDPRQSFTSATTARYTTIRTVSGGINVTF